MAGRPHKKGLDYLPLDVDFWDKEKVEDFIEDFGAKAVIILLQLWCFLYTKGYYFDIKASKRTFCKKRGIDPSEFDTLVLALVERKFFSRDKYERYNILTSDSTQERLLFASKRRSEVKYSFEYLEIELANYPKFKDVVKVYTLDGTQVTDIFKVKKAAKTTPAASIKTPVKKPAAIPSKPPGGHTYSEILEFISIPYKERTDLFKQQIPEQLFNSFVVINKVIDKDFKNLRESRYQMSIHEWHTLYKETKFTESELLSVLAEISGAGVSETAGIASKLKAYIGYSRKKLEREVLKKSTEVPKHTSPVLYDFRNEKQSEK